MAKKKSLKQSLNRFMPSGLLKEKMKSWYYNLVQRGPRFGVVAGPPICYTTTHQGLTITTKFPLYSCAHEFAVYQKFYTLKPGDVIIDAGSNTGYISMLFSKIVGPQGCIYAFEPDAINIGYIHENIALNPEATNIVISDLLLWNKNTSIDFYESGTVGSSALWLPLQDKVVKKQTITIDDWVKANNIEKIDFIKMNIEGAEIEAVEGCVETIKHMRPNFAIYSNHKVNGEMTYHKLEALFKSLDYPYKTLINGTEIITYAGDLK